ncbi:MAG: hypothetical protein JJ855_19850 [Rhodospirillales bacterium]|nr:hypothetical protein [Rhodospirillales bacterium]
MFLNLLTERQKQSFLALATKVSMADGEVVPAENVTLNVRVAEMGGHVKAPPDEIYGDAKFEVFDTRQSQTIVVLELMVIAYSDAEYHEYERPIIDELIEKFDFNAEQVARFEDWAKRQSPLSVEGWGLIAEAGPVEG